MPELNALPTDDDLIFVRSDINETFPSETTVEDWLNVGLAQVKRDLDNKRNLEWKQVYDTTNDAYFDNDNATGRNADNIKQMIMLAAVYRAFEQYSIRSGEESEWWGFYLHYKAKYEELLTGARLDEDLNQDGTVDTGEGGSLGQSFFTR